MNIWLIRHRDTHSKQITSHFLELFRVGINPTLGSKTMSILAEYCLVLVKHPCIDTDDSTPRKMDPRYGLSTGWDMAFEDETNRGVNTKGFVDDCGSFRGID